MECSNYHAARKDMAMAHFEYDIGIIGGGAAGLTVAAGAAQVGAKALLVEKEPDLGGDCLHFGCVPSKTLIKTASVYHQIKQSKHFGLPALDPPPVDFTQVRGRISSVIERIQKHDSRDRFCRMGVRVERGQASFCDDHAVDLNGRRVTANSWVIATGSYPAVPPVPGLSDISFLTNREIFSLDSLPASLVILGAGPIAIELAQAFCRLGTRVTVVQRSAQILSREDPDMAGALMEVMKNEGVTFYLGTGLKQVRQHGGLYEVGFDTADGEYHSIRASSVLVAAGRKPGVDTLVLENAGVRYTVKGLELDGRLRTARRHIYGAGDVTGEYQFTHAAGYEGGIVLSNAVFHLPRKADYTFMPRCTYSEPELAAIGMNEKQARARGIRYSVFTESFEHNDRSLAEGAETGMLKMLLDGKEKPIGVQILGPRAGELLNEWVAVFGGKVKLSALASAVHPYPTLGEINKRVCGSYLAPKIFSDSVKKGLKLLFHLKGRAYCD
jgi:pyruvate/2-oxoglutarate dehydrogenase complex dihydrolipoamide dehydrogenase (E3) component